MYYVDRNTDNEIYAAYPVKQYTDQESVENNNPDLLTFFLNLKKKDIKMQLSNLRNIHALVGIIYGGNNFYSGATSGSYMLGGFNYLELSVKTALNWKLMDGTYTMVNEIDLKNLFEINSDLIEDCFAHEETLLGQINAATTIAQLDAIDINSGWPPAPSS